MWVSACPRRSVASRTAERSIARLPSSSASAARTERSESVAIAPNSRPEGARSMIEPSFLSEVAAAVPESPSAAKQSSSIPFRPALIPLVSGTPLTGKAWRPEA